MGLRWKNNGQMPHYSSEPINIEGTFTPQQELEADIDAASTLSAEQPEVYHEPKVAEHQALELNVQQMSPLDLFRKRKAEGFDYLIAAGLPALVGLAAGVPESGYMEGAKNIDRIIAGEMAHDKTLMGLWHKAKSSKSSNIPKMQLKPDSMGRAYNYDPSTGRVFDLYGKEVDPEKFRMGNTIEKQSAIMGKRDEFAQDREKRAYAQKSRELVAKELNKIRPDIRSLESTLAQMGTGQFQDKVGITNAIRSVEKGVLSDRDRAYYVSRNEDWKSLLNFLTRQADGKFNPELIGEVKSYVQRAIDRMYKISEEQADTLLEAGQAKNPHGIQRGFFKMSNGDEIIEVAPEEASKYYRQGYRFL